VLEYAMAIDVLLHKPVGHAGKARMMAELLSVHVAQAGLLQKLCVAIASALQVSNHEMGHVVRGHGQCAGRRHVAK